jgi:hypothetical protein
MSYYVTETSKFDSTISNIPPNTLITAKPIAKAQPKQISKKRMPVTKPITKVISIVSGDVKCTKSMCKRMTISSHNGINTIPTLSDCNFCISNILSKATDCGHYKDVSFVVYGNPPVQEQPKFSFNTRSKTIRQKAAIYDPSGKIKQQWKKYYV